MSCLVHRIEDAPVHRLQAVAHVRQRAADDHAHGVIEIGAAHLLDDRDRIDVGWAAGRPARQIGFVRQTMCSSSRWKRMVVSISDSRRQAKSGAAIPDNFLYLFQWLIQSFFCHRLFRAPGRPEWTDLRVFGAGAPGNRSRRDSHCPFDRLARNGRNAMVIRVPVLAFAPPRETLSCPTSHMSSMPSPR